MTVRPRIAAIAGILTLTAATVAVPATGHAEIKAGTGSCSELRQDYSGGVAKSKKAADRIVKKGFQRPIVCKRLYLQVHSALDPNGNKVACETR